MNNSGPRIEPWGTPVSISLIEDDTPLQSTYWDVAWISWCLKSPPFRLSVQKLYQVDNKIEKICITVPLWGESSLDASNAESISMSWRHHDIVLGNVLKHWSMVLHRHWGQNDRVNLYAADLGSKWTLFVTLGTTANYSWTTPIMDHISNKMIGIISPHTKWLQTNFTNAVNI